MFEVEFICDKCAQPFTVDYQLGEDVTCAHCQTVFRTDYDDSDDGIINPWLCR